MLKRSAGVTLRHARFRKGLTIRELAALASVSTTTIVKLERGESADGKKVYALAAQLDLEGSDLFEEPQEVVGI